MSQRPNQRAELIDGLADIVMAVKDDKELKRAIVTVLKPGSYTQQARVTKLKKVLEENAAPTVVINFIGLLADDKFAHQVLDALENDD